MGTTKVRTLNELRQEKEFGYNHPSKQIDYKKLNLDPKHIIDLVKKYPNDIELGKNVRSYLIELGIFDKEKNEYKKTQENSLSYGEPKE